MTALPQQRRESVSTFMNERYENPERVSQECGIGDKREHDRNRGRDEQRHCLGSRVL